MPMHIYIHGQKFVEKIDQAYDFHVYLSPPAVFLLGRVVDQNIHKLWHAWRDG
jgi:hypothetical protein